MANNNQLDAGLDLMRRLPPQKCNKHLSDTITIAPQLCDDLLSMVDQPLQVARDKETGREYLKCDYNRDMDSYRSPWSNTYDPPINDPVFPSDTLRKLEVEANATFQAYCEMYFEGGISSVYFWELEHPNFAGVILIKKQADGLAVKGCWDSIHVVECKSQTKNTKYKLTSTVILWLLTDNADVGEMSVGGSLTRTLEYDYPVSEQQSHLVNIGRMVEENENKMRGFLNDVYFGKTREIVGSLRTVESATELGLREKLAEDIRDALQNNSRSE
ncbi:F-actin-capping protein subunit beta [Aphelenchoides besseyi]|nr:F-actin-capping protein subunit beta [Aphelenchoides besseyi]KAI6194709.1 F-actin-capping protein subunit beta [Aphelenchoides besseyi]